MQNPNCTPQPGEPGWDDVQRQWGERHAVPAPVHPKPGPNDPITAGDIATAQTVTPRLVLGWDCPACGGRCGTGGDELVARMMAGQSIAVRCAKCAVVSRLARPKREAPLVQPAGAVPNRHARRAGLAGGGLIIPGK